MPIEDIASYGVNYSCPTAVVSTKYVQEQPEGSVAGGDNGKPKKKHWEGIGYSRFLQFTKGRGFR